MKSKVANQWHSVLMCVTLPRYQSLQKNLDTLDFFAANKEYLMSVVTMMDISATLLFYAKQT